MERLEIIIKISAKMLASTGSNFGNGFHGRAQEAICCYGAHAYFACCAMCGAAAESILLAIAIKKVGDENKVLDTYMSKGGRGRIEHLIIGQAHGDIKKGFNASYDLLKYWRDCAAHGHQSGIQDNEAYTSLALLLRFTQFASDNWDLLTNS